MLQSLLYCCYLHTLDCTTSMAFQGLWVCIMPLPLIIVLQVNLNCSAQMLQILFKMLGNISLREIDWKRGPNGQKGKFPVFDKLRGSICTHTKKTRAWKKLLRSWYGIKLGVQKILFLKWDKLRVRQVPCNKWQPLIYHMQYYNSTVYQYGI